MIVGNRLATGGRMEGGRNAEGWIVLVLVLVFEKVHADAEGGIANARECARM